LKNDIYYLTCERLIWIGLNRACIVVIFDDMYNFYIMQSKPLKNLNGQICQICGDTVGLTASGEVFVACHECSFPICYPCYEYEWKNV